MNPEQVIAQNETAAVELLRTLCAIPAPSHREERRAEFCKNWLEAHGAEGVFIDEALNVIWPYHAENAEKVHVFMAHTDTVFPDMEPMPMVESDGKMYCPGVGDDTANVVLLMLTAAQIAQTKPETADGIVIALNSCEEGLGNLKGCRALMARYGDRAADVISFDGYMEGVCSAAVGSLRWKVTVRTAGGHSYAAFGNANAIERLGAIVQALYAYKLPEDGSRTTYNVGVMEGGTSVNTIAQEAHMLFEFRSDDLDSLLAAKAFFEETITAFRETGLCVETELLGERPCGKKENNDPRQAALLARLADSVENRTGKAPGFHAGSTDCNIPLSMGIPAAAVGLCSGGGAHTREEWIEINSLKAGLGIAMDLISAHFLPKTE